MVQPVVDLALELRGDDGAFAVEFRLSRGIDSVMHQGPFPVYLEPERLRTLIENPSAYASALTEMLFCSPEIRETFATARGMARAQQAPLRLRLQLGPGAQPLHALRWELLNLPDQPARLATREDIIFSRYVPAGADAGLPGAPERLRVLAAVAAPVDLDRYNLAAIDLEEEKSRASAGLAGLSIDWLAGGMSERCTLNRLVERIPGHDVLYLVCHGLLARETGWLLLEQEDGSAARVSVDDLTRRLSGVLSLPRLAVLVVCGSAGGDAMAALAPRLVETGIPAVVGMHGVLTFPTASLFLPVLFRELQRDGVMDRAVSAARRAILDRPDEAAPVLLMSLLSGRLWAQSATVTPEPVSAHSTSKPADVDPVAFYHHLNSDAFQLEDLEDLCFTLGVDWEVIRGQTKPAKARALIQYFTSRGRLPELMDAARRARPHLGI